MYKLTGRTSDPLSYIKKKRASLFFPPQHIAHFFTLCNKYMYIHIFIYIYMCVCVCVCECLCLYLCVSGCLYMY